MRSWKTVLVEASPPDIFPAEPLVVLSGATALVICDEVIGSARMIATNVFANEDGAWRLVHHQATRLRAADGDSQSEADKRARE